MDGALAMKTRRLLLTAAAIALVVTLFFHAPSAARAEATLLNVSYDVTREFYEDFNAAFVQFWKGRTGETVAIKQSHGGSSKQARAVVDGLEADVVTMNQANDIDILYGLAKLVPETWAKRLPNNSAPTTSTTVFLVRKGNPKQIKDWDDLVKPGVALIVPNPKTSGNGRYSYLAAYGYALKRGKTPKQAEAFVGQLFRNVPVLDSGGRAATTTFVQRSIGDVLLTFENEVSLIKQELGGDQFDVVYPSISILAENPVTVVDAVVDRKGTRKLAEAYLRFLYSEVGQELAIKHHFRPRSARALANHPGAFPKLQLFTVEELFGGWKKAQREHFDDGGSFDRIAASMHGGT
jgi:sulfate transport system substrate-binding protein